MIPASPLHNQIGRQLRGQLSRVVSGVAGSVVSSALLLLAACESEPAPEPAKYRGNNQIVAPDPYSARTFVFDTVGFTRADPKGNVPGFDLDGTTATVCDKSDFTAPDGTPGVDNQFATLVPIIEFSGLAAFEGLLQSSIDNGGILLMIDVADVQDWQNDPSVTVKLRAGRGLPLLGTDGLLLAGQTFWLSDRSPELLLPNARIENGILLTGSFDGELPISVFEFDYVLDMRNARFRAKVVSDARLEEGLLGGGITLTSIEKVAQTAAIDQPDLYETITTLVAGVGDLVPGPDGVCTQISAVLKITAIPAYLYPDGTPMPGTP